MQTKAFFLEPTGNVRAWLRRYSRGNGNCTHPSNNGYHQAYQRVADCIPEAEEARGDDTFQRFPKDHPLWPKQCQCGHVFEDGDNWQYTTRKIYQRVDNGQTMLLRDVEDNAYRVPVGAMWDANHYGSDPGVDNRVGVDGMSLNVMTPEREWCVDARASNCDSPCKHCGVPYKDHKIATCTNPGDGERPYTKGQYVDSRPHYCWVRHGDPRTGNVHVDKNGVTCNAGAGSIQQDHFHGFLHNGFITNC